MLEPFARAETPRATSPSVPPPRVAQAKEPLALTFAVNVSVDPVLVRVVVPKVAVPVKYPVMMLEPFARAETPYATSVPVPPPRVAQAKEPLALTFAVNVSSDPALLVRVVAPKIAVPLKDPVMMLEPSGSAETPRATSLPYPPPRVAQAKEPLALTFAVNVSADPSLLVRVVLPKVAVPLKYPVMMLEPFARTAAPLA